MKTVSCKPMRHLFIIVAFFNALISFAAPNVDFGRIVDEQIVYAPDVLVLSDADGFEIVRGKLTLTASDYLAQGWKRIVDEKPAASASNKVVVATGWAEDETTITRQYAEEDAPEPVKVPRKFSKLKIYGAISKLGAWEKVQAWLEGKTVDGVNGWIAFQLAQEVSEDNALFSAWAEEARQLLGLTEEQFDAFLGQCILE